jgi:hypothetical protein
MLWLIPSEQMELFLRPTLMIQILREKLFMDAVKLFINRAANNNFDSLDDFKEQRNNLVKLFKKMIIERKSLLSCIRQTFNMHCAKSWNEHPCQGV